MQIISAKYVITMTQDVIVSGAVAVENGEVIDVGREEDLIHRYEGATHEDYPHHVVMPGLINCHTHLDMSLYQNYEKDPVRNEGQSIEYIDWLQGNIQYKKNIDPSQQRLAVEWGIEECLQSGTTCIADMSSYEGIFPILEHKGLRAVLFPEVLSITNEVTKDLFESAMAIIEKYMDHDSDLISVGAGPYSTYTLSRNILKIMSQFSRNAEIPLMIHAAESFAEMEFFNDSTGSIATKLFPNIGWDEMPPERHQTPIQYLSQIGFLDASPLLVGCTQITDKDMDHISQSGSKIVITPRSHMNLGQGKAPLKDILKKHICAVLGTDGIPSVDTLSLWDEMRAFVRFNNDLVALSGYDVLSMVTTKAAAALGLGDEVGSLEKGKKADMILIDVSDIPQEGDLLMNLIQNVTNFHIKSVMIGGRNVKTMS